MEVMKARAHSKTKNAAEESARAAIRDVKPQTPVARVNVQTYSSPERRFALEDVAAVVGMAPYFVRKVVGNHSLLSEVDLAELLEQDAFQETFVPRSKVLHYLRRISAQTADLPPLRVGKEPLLVRGNSLELIQRLPSESINCVVTSTPYWAMRIYKDMTSVAWADGETCPFGLEQTPEGFIRHSVEILNALRRSLAADGSVWWNLMDTYNTRTQVRGNAAEALRAMQGKDKRGWHDHECRRYSAGHSYLHDGEQCLIPFRVAERASRLGYLVKSTICWGKTSSLPEPQKTRVSRNVEYILHLSKQRSPFFDKTAFKSLPVVLGGRNPATETDKLSDLWLLPTASGLDDHGAQFPLALPGRCIGISTRPGDTVLDPFTGAGTTGAAATILRRGFIGFDTSQGYLDTAVRRIKALSARVSRDEKLVRDAQAAAATEL